METNLIRESAVGKIILIGEHAVVYGEPAIAMPFSEARVTASISEKKGPVDLDCIYYKGELFKAPEILLGLSRLVEEITKSFNKKLEDFTIRIDSTIPPERGMGSSAAVAIATTRALYKYFNKKLSYEKLTNLANISETVIHGTPSGIDAATIAGEKPLYFIKGEPFKALKLNLDGYLIVADTGEKGQTKATVASVRNLTKSNPKKYIPLIKELGQLTNQARESIEKNNKKLLGQLMIQAHKNLQELGVSNQILDRLVEAALDQGALGAKLTGGGRGGCMIALAADKKSADLIAKSLIENGAKNVWIDNLGDDLIDI